MKKSFEQILTWFEDTFQDGETEDWYHKKIVDSVVAPYTTKAKLKEELSNIIVSLQQEQTPTEREIAEAHRYAEIIRERDKARIQQEQPEVDLEEAARHVYESWMGGTMDDVRRDMAELGKVLNARKEE